MKSKRNRLRINSRSTRSCNYWTLLGELPESNFASFEAMSLDGFIASNASRRSATSSARRAGADVVADFIVHKRRLWP